MIKRISGAIFLLMILAVPVMLLWNGGWQLLQRAATARTDPLGKVEQVTSEQFPWSSALKQLQVSVNYLAGGKEQNGVFISGNTLSLDVQPKDQETINKNTLSMVDFADDYQVPTYVMLIPTACAVQQERVPYAQVAPLYDQRMLIDDTYRLVSGHVTAIDVYPTLFSHQDEYIYYNTDNCTTGLGGYYIYEVAARRLGIARVRGMEEFSVEHLDYGYYGDLYEKSPYSAVEPDRVSAYYFNKSWRSYTVTHYDRNGSRRYYTLYPKFRGELGDTMDILLGGMSPVIDIEIGNSLYSGQAYSSQLLIFGDRSVQSYLPFLLTNYERVTVVDTSSVTPAMLSEIDVEHYNQVLFAYSVDSFVSMDQMSVLSALPAPQEEN